MPSKLFFRNALLVVLALAGGSLVGWSCAHAAEPVGAYELTSDFQTPTERAVEARHQRLWDNEGGKGHYHFSYQDRVAFGAQVVIGILDVVTTMHAVHAGCPETNSLIGSHPSDAAIVGFAVIRTIGFYYLLDHSGAAGRAFTWGANATGVAIVANNFKGC